MEFRFDRRSGVAAYLQLVKQTTKVLRLGLMQPGDRLPTAREVVASTAINPNTVLKAYRELEREGLVEGRVGAGRFVTRRLARAEGSRASVTGVARGVWTRSAHDAGLQRHEVEALMKS